MSVSLPGVRPPGLRGRVRTLLCALAMGAAAAGCDDGNGPGTDLPYGRVGSVRVEVRAPLDTAAVGELRQSVLWSSDGPWLLTEQIYYKGGLGDETVRKSTDDPGALATRYADWVLRLTQPGGPLELFVPNLPAALVPTCGQLQSRVTLRIYDKMQADSTSWTRCGDGSLASLSSENAGPESGYAARVVEAVKLLRDATVLLDRRFNEKGYAYTGSLPFKTIERGDSAKVPLLVPRVIEDQQAWVGFWSEFMSASKPLPVVDFGKEVVLVGAVGTRQEIGDSVEIRRILPIGFATQVNLFERRPGDFCTPAPRVHAPFHIVVAPSLLMPRPVYFSAAGVDQVPCG